MTEPNRPQNRTVARRLHALRRDRESVLRILEQANLDRVQEEAFRTMYRLERMEIELGAEDVSDVKGQLDEDETDSDVDD